MIELIVLVIIAGIHLSYIAYLKSKTACKHSFKIINSCNLLTRENAKVGERHTLQCNHCGTIEFKEFINSRY